MISPRGALNLPAARFLQTKRFDPLPFPPPTCSKQQVEASFESRENPKRRKRSDDEYKTPTIHHLNNTAPPSEYTKPVTMTIFLGNTPTSGGTDETLLTVSETRTAQTMDA